MLHGTFRPRYLGLCLQPLEGFSLAQGSQRRRRHKPLNRLWGNLGIFPQSPADRLLNEEFFGVLVLLDQRKQQRCVGLSLVAQLKQERSATQPDIRRPAPGTNHRLSTRRMLQQQLKLLGIQTALVQLL